MQGAQTLGKGNHWGTAETISVWQVMLMLNCYVRLRSLSTRKEGQGMVEYALILVLVSIVVIVILFTMGRQIKNVFSNVVAALG
jgi:pilus assembly protein Flp/PilA